MFELIQHTADVRLRVEAPTLADLFRDAVQGMYAVMRGEARGGGRVQRTIAVDDSADTTALLVDFLNEVLNRAHIGREMFETVTFTVSRNCRSPPSSRARRAPNSKRT